MSQKQILSGLLKMYLVFLISGVALFFNACSRPVMEEAENENCQCSGVNPKWLQKIIDKNPDDITRESVNNNKQASAYLSQYSNVVDRLAKPLPEMPTLSNPISEFDDINIAESFEQAEDISKISDNKIIPELPVKESSEALEIQPKLPNITVNNNMFDEDKTLEPVSYFNELSYIEKIYNELSGASKGKKLQQFGYMLFVGKNKQKIKNINKGLNKKSKSSKEDLLSGDLDLELIDLPELDDSVQSATGLFNPVDPDYLVGIGDEVILKTIGALNLEKKLIVDRNGEVFVPEVGSVRVQGIKASKVHDVILNSLKNQYHNIQVEVTLGRTQSIRVLFAGKFDNPGLLVIPANSTLIDALSIAKPTKDGTLRNIKLLRKGKDEQEIDLYRTLTGKSAEVNEILLSGDTIYIGPIGKTAAIVLPQGGSIFELKEGQSLSELLSYIGNSGRFFRQNKISVERNDKNNQRKVFELDIKKNGREITARDGDVLNMPEIYSEINDVVELTGSIVKPGTYPYSSNMRISDLLRRGNGFLIEASLGKALLIRRLGREHSFDISPGDKRGVIREETIWVDIGEILSGNSQADIPLQRLDRLKILSKKESQDTPFVSIIGAVRKPGIYRLSGGLNLGALLNLAGGATGDAYQGRGIIVRRTMNSNGRHFDVEQIPFKLNDVIHSKDSANINLKNYDQVFIRKVQSLQVKVKIDGRVQFPGTYVLPDGSKISDLLVAAGGLLDKADLRGAVFSRASIRKLQQRRLEELFAHSEEKFSRNRNYITRDGRVNEAVASHLDLLGLSRVSEDMRKFQTSGRVVLDFTSEDFDCSENNLVLEDLDYLYIPKVTNSVLVLGKVFYPNAFVYRENMTVDDYLNLAGGMKDDADTQQVYLVMSSGEVRSTAQKKSGLAFYSYVPGPGDSILVPAKPIGRSKLHFLSDTVALLRQMTETGLIGATIPRVMDKETNFATGLDLGTAPQAIPVNVGKPYDEMLMREKGLRLK